MADLAAGQAQVLVLTGEPGVGKTALLDDLASSASTCRVERAVGIEAEMELPFAGLHQLCAPMLDRLGELPDPQREALTVAFGLNAGSAPDRFLVGLGVLHLLATVAEDGPLLCIVDDTQWLDRTSVQALAFVARRLLAEQVAMVFAVREPLEELDGVPVLEILPLGNREARHLLESAIPGRLDQHVQDRIVAEARGNPLAILELPREFTVARLAGGFGVPGSDSPAIRMEQSFARRLGSLPEDTQRLLLVAAAEPVGDVSLLWRAADRLGIGAEAAAPAVSAGLIEVGSRVRFRHPLVRSAIYGRAGPADRQEVHRALSEATDEQTDPDRRAWHRAHAAAGPDEAVASDLEQSAARAQARGGIAAAAAFLERAAELTPDSKARAERGLAAAEASIEAGSPDSAERLLETAEIGPLDDLQQARSMRLRARILFARNRGNDAPPLYLAAARRLESLDPLLAREAYLEALAAVMFSGRLSGTLGLREVSESFLAAPDGPQPTRPLDLLLEGLATRFTQGIDASLDSLREALDAFCREELQDQDEIVRWLRLAPIAQEAAVHELWDDDLWHEFSSRAVRLARDIGALIALPVSLAYRAGSLLHAGELETASALMDEADAITDVTGNARVRYASLVLAAWRGIENDALPLFESDLSDASARGEGRVLGVVGYATAVLYNGLGRYEAALAGARQARDYQDSGFYGWSLAELVEAGTRGGDREAAIGALGALEERTGGGGSDWAAGVVARSRALLASGAAADGLYREAIFRLEQSRMVVHLARAHLVYGEWLRRENRRVDAREQLRAAHAMFDDMGAVGFAERTRRELVATGENVSRRSVDNRFLLTAQESQVAQLAADGHTNPEIGSQLFISPRTVEYHLHKVFTKLGIASRRELSGALRART